MKIHQNAARISAGREQGGLIGGSKFAYFDTRKDCGLYMETIMLDAEGREMFARIKRGEF